MSQSSASRRVNKTFTDLKLTGGRNVIYPNLKTAFPDLWIFGGALIEKDLAINSNIFIEGVSKILSELETPILKVDVIDPLQSSQGVLLNANVLSTQYLTVKNIQSWPSQDLHLDAIDSRIYLDSQGLDFQSHNLYNLPSILNLDCSDLLITSNVIQIHLSNDLNIGTGTNFYLNTGNLELTVSKISGDLALLGNIIVIHTFIGGNDSHFLGDVYANESLYADRINANVITYQNMSILGNLEVLKNMYIYQDLYVHGNLFLGGVLAYSALLMIDLLTVLDGTMIQGLLESYETTINQNLNISSYYQTSEFSFSSSGGLVLNGDVFINGTLDVVKDLIIDGNEIVEGNLIINGHIIGFDILTANSLSISHDLTVSGNLTASQRVTILNLLECNTSSSIYGNVYMYDHFNVTNLTSTGSLSVYGDTNVQSNVNVSHNVTVLKNTELDGNFLHIHNNMTEDQTVTTDTLIAYDALVHGNFNVSESAYLQQNASITYDANIGMNLHALQNLNGSTGIFDNAVTITAPSSLKVPNGNVRVEGHVDVSGYLNTQSVVSFPHPNGLMIDPVGTGNIMLLGNVDIPLGYTLYVETIQGHSPIHVLDDMYVQANMNVSQTANVHGSLTVDTNMTAASNMIFAHDLSIQTNLQVGGTANFLGTVTGVVQEIDTVSGELTGGPITSTGTIGLADVGSVTPGTYNFAAITVDQKGRVTSASSGTATSDLNMNAHSLTNVNDLTFSGNLVCTGLSSTPATLVSGSNLVNADPAWTARTPVEDSSYNGVDWSSSLGLFIATCSNRVSGPTTYCIYSSPNGVNWTGRDSTALNGPGINGGPVMCFDYTGLTNKVVCGFENCYVAHSTDGINFTFVTIGTTGAQYVSDFDINPTNGRICCCAGASGAGKISYSDNGGISWTNTLSTGTQLNGGIAYSPVADAWVCLAVGNYRSTDNGLSWSTMTSADDSTFWAEVIWVDSLGLFIAVGLSGATFQIQRSATGASGTWIGSATGLNLRGITFCPEFGVLVAVGGSGNSQYSYNGYSWSSSVYSATNNNISITWSPNLNIFVVVQNSGSQRIRTSPAGGVPSLSYTLNYSYYIAKDLSSYSNGAFVNGPSVTYYGSFDGVGTVSNASIPLTLSSGTFYYVDLILTQSNPINNLSLSYKISNYFFQRSSYNIFTGTNLIKTMTGHDSFALTFSSTTSSVNLLITGYHYTNWYFRLTLTPRT